jgi:hypothetical protein
MKAYPYRKADWRPGARLKKPLSGAKVAVVTTAAFFRPDHSLEINRRPGIGEICKHEVGAFYFRDDAIIYVVIVLDPIYSDGPDVHRTEHLFDSVIHGIRIRMPESHGDKATQSGDFIRH